LKKIVYYFGGTPTYTVVQKFNTENNFTSSLGFGLPSQIRYASGVSNKEDGTHIIFNGRNTRNVIEFYEATETAKVIGDLPFISNTLSAFSTTAAIPNGQGSGVWIFAGNDPMVPNPILLFNTKDKTVSIPTWNKIWEFPTLYETPAAVTDGRYWYIIGGLGRAMEIGPPIHPGQGILR
jgi:hypothetical protein